MRLWIARVRFYYVGPCTSLKIKASVIYFALFIVLESHLRYVCVQCNHFEVYELVVSIGESLVARADEL